MLVIDDRMPVAAAQELRAILEEHEILTVLPPAPRSEVHLKALPEIQSIVIEKPSSPRHYPGQGDPYHRGRRRPRRG